MVAVAAGVVGKIQSHGLIKIKAVYKEIENGNQRKQGK